MTRRLLTVLTVAAIAILTGGSGAWATEDGCVGSDNYCTEPTPTPTPTPDLEVTVGQPELVVSCPDEVGVYLPAVTGADWYWNGQGPVATVDELNAMSLDGGPWTFTVSLVAQPGFVLVGDHEWTYSGDAETCPTPSPTLTPAPTPAGTPPAPPTPPTLPDTGLNPALALLGFLLIATGIGAIFGGSR